MLPCNVVVRATPAGTTVIEALDPSAMMGLSDDEALHTVATDARQRLTAGPRRSHPGDLMQLDPDGMTPVINRIKRAQGQLGRRPAAARGRP